MGELTERTRVPLWGTVVSGTAAGVISFFFDINILAEMISMGTLMAFSLVCGGILVLRVHHPTHRSRPTHLLLLFVLLSFLLTICLRFASVIPIPILVLEAVLLLVPVILFARIPCEMPEASYATPFMPYLPLFGIFCNIYLITSNQVSNILVYIMHKSRVVCEEVHISMKALICYLRRMMRMLYELLNHWREGKAER